MTEILGGEVDVYVECMDSSLETLIALAKRVDSFVGVEPPADGYGLAEAVSAIFNGGTSENIQVALNTLAGWSFQPRGGWSLPEDHPDRKE